MLQNIIDLLKLVEGETENVRIAQGKYHLPDSIKEGYNQMKKEIKWHKNIQ